MFKNYIENANFEDTGFSYTLSLIRGKYKMVILYCLMEFNIVRYNELKGEGFKAFVKQGDEIKIGQKLIEFDIDLLKSKGYCLDVPIVITNMMNYTEVVCTKETNINIGENLLSIK